MAVLLLREAAAYVLAVDGLRPGEGLRLVALLKAAAAAAAERQHLTFTVHLDRSVCMTQGMYPFRVPHAAGHAPKAQMRAL